MSSEILVPFLRRAGRRLVIVRAIQVAAGAVGAAVLAVVLAVLLDATFGFAAGVLIALDGVIVGTAAVGLAMVVRALCRTRPSTEAVAVHAERALRIGDNSIVNAVELDAAAPPGISRSLAALAVRSGERVVATVPLRRAIDARPARGPLRFAAAVLVVAAVVPLVAPRMVEAVVPRLLHPLSDLPPFTLLTFDVRVEPERVVYGRPAQIRVGIGGPMRPETADIVFVDQAGSKRVPLARHGDEGLALRLDRAEASREFYIDTARGRSRRYALVVHPIPVAERAAMRLEYPAYTGWPAAELPISPAEVRAIEGTVVTFTVESSLPLACAEVALDGGGGASEANGLRLTPVAADGKVVRGSMTLERSGAFQIDLVGADGTRGEEPVRGRLAAVADGKPTVAIMDPPENLIAPEGWSVPVGVAARDDVGVTRMTMHVGVNTISASAIELTMDQPGAVYATASHTIELDALGAKAGDAVRYYASAYDGKPGPDRFADTPVQSIFVISREEYAAMARAEYGAEQMEAELDGFLERMERLREQRGQLREELADAMKKAQDAGGRLGAEEQERMRQLADLLQRNAAETELLARAMRERAQAPMLYDMEEMYKALLEEQAENQEGSAAAAEELAKAMDAAAESGAMSAEEREQMEQLARELAEADKAGEEGEEAAERAQQDMAKLAQAAAMQEQASRLSEIIEKQRDIASRLGQFKEMPELSPEDRERAQRLGEEQRELAEELRETAERLAKLAEESRATLPKMSESAAGICEALGELNVGVDQQVAATAAQAGQGGEAHAAADAAAEKLESLAGECQGMSGEPSDELDGALGLSKSQLSRAMQQFGAGRRGMRPGQGGRMAGMGNGMDGPGARFAMVGPHFQGRERPQRPRRGFGPDDGEALASDPAWTARGVERLDPGSAAVGRGRGGVLNGVPARYRDAAASYFKRLAEDGAGRGGGR